MKKLMLALAMMIGVVHFSTAQTTAPATKKVATKKAVPATPATTPAPAVAPVKATTPQGVVLKKDGTPDKRYKTPAGSGPLKKDGTPDKRYKANKKN